jgi:HD superfamily phosphohydrolase YqeK/tetratricopeptide (TPR) repeat protein
VIECHMSFDKERKVTLAQMDLVTHFAQGLDTATAQQLHARLAQYFTNPIAQDVGQSLDDRYGRAEAGAKHWASANRPREAADAERIAAQLAEQGLAYREARGHYQAAIRLLTQLLAENPHNETVSHVEHEDLLILSNCLYRLGQMTRLASERGSAEGGTDAVVYFKHALKRLRELSAILHDKRLAAPLSLGRTSSSPRDIPEPNITRHHIRLTEALSGYINLELAELHGIREKSARSRELLFETLRHAEAARGEAGSRWLLAAASARLAQQLAHDAAEVRHSEPVRAHNLAVEALFHIERVIGLRAVSPDEDRDLDDPRSRAWGVLGQIFKNLDNEPRLAEWAFRRMNEHRRDVSDVVDMMTDRQLGMFLLSLCPAVPDDADAANEYAGARSVIDEARALLEGYARWAFESGIDQEQSGAYLSLALVALVERTVGWSPDLALAHEQIEKAIAFASDDRQGRAAYLLQGVLHAMGSGKPDDIALDAGPVEEAFRAAGLDALESATADDVLRAGWRASLMRMLAVSPRMKELVRPVAKRLFGDELEDSRSELADALSRADQYVERLARDRGLVPSSDRAIWRLLEGRVPKETFDHARNTQTAARRLLETHRIELEAGGDFGFDQQVRDVDYAVAVHDWYRSTDPARLLTLARESNASISGSEWASPNLLRGRLAIQLLRHQYFAEIEIGRQRFARIESMVTNRTIGSKEAGPLDQVFYLASQMAEPDLAARVVSAKKSSLDWRRVALEPGGLGEAYRLAVAEREALVRQAGLPLVQDLHLLDAAAAQIQEEDQTTIDLTKPAEVSTPS